MKKVELDLLADSSGVEPSADEALVIHSRSLASGGKRQDRNLLNDAFGYFVALSAVLTALPVALNRPVLWLGWAALIGVAVFAFIFLKELRLDRRPYRTRRYLGLFALAFLVPLWANIQSLPFLGSFAGSDAFPANMKPGNISLLPSASQTASLRFLSYFLFAFLTLEISTRESRLRIMVWIIFWGVVAHALWGLVALKFFGDIHVWGEEKTYYRGVVTGTFVNRNSFATFLAMGAVLGLALLLDRIDNPRRRHVRSRSFMTAEKLNRLIIVVGLILIFAALLGTSSRMGVFSGGVGIFTCYFLMRLKSGAALGRTLLHAGAVLLCVILVGVFVFGQDLAWRSFFIDRAGDTRIDGYLAILEMIGARPWFGYGFDGFRPAFELSSSSRVSVNTIWDRAHSTYLANWFELGVLIGSIPILILMLTARHLWTKLATMQHDYFYLVAALSVLVIAALHSLVDFSFEMPANVILLVAILGMGLGLPADRRKQKADR